MSKEKPKGMQLSSLDDLFSTQAQRDKKVEDEVQLINISLIDEFPNHPYKVIDNEEMYQMAESIKEHGVVVPTLIRPKEDGRYEMIAGHRRMRASILAEQEKIPAIVRDYDNDIATIIMVDSNIQREHILPSERAKAYKMRLDAMKHQGKRTDLTYSPTDNKLKGEKSAEIMSKEIGESMAQIYRYIRLNDLVPQLLQLVDDEKMGLRPAVELSYLDVDTQNDIVEAVEMYQCTPSHAQTRLMRKVYDEGNLTSEMISEIMGEDKPNQKEKYSISVEKVKKYIPKGMPINKTEDFICKALEYYSKHLQQINAKKSQEQVR